MLTADQKHAAHQAGYHMRDAHKDRASVPLYAMGEDGRAWQLQWQAGWDKRDGEIKRGVAA